MNEIIESEIDKLIPIIFLNKTNNPINISLFGIENLYDMFCFCIDLFIKGLLFLYSSEDNQVDLDKITMDQIETVIAQIKKTGINTLISEEYEIKVEEKNDDNENNNCNNINNIEDKAGLYIPVKNDSFTNLDDYKVLIILKNSTKFSICFKCERYIN
jgi:hypothetical protein